MELKGVLASNPRVRDVIKKMDKQSKTLAGDVVCAFNLFYNNNLELSDPAKRRLEQVFVMCKYMEPEAEDVISMLLFSDYLANKVTKRDFMQRMNEKRYVKHYEKMTEYCNIAPTNPAWSREECIDYCIMMNVCDKMFGKMIWKINKDRSATAVSIQAAYSIAKNAHKWAKRKSGEPYLVHPVCVAAILEQAGAESSVIAAALLHDVIEDTDVTREDIQKVCGVKIAQYVDAVTSVHQAYKNSHVPDEYQCDKAQLDEKSFEKLVQTVHERNDMMSALYIKAADRIHNLSTIEAMPDVKIYNKTDETQLDYLPLFKAFKMDYFVQKIEDLMWRATDVERYSKMVEKYEDLVSRNRESINLFVKILNEHTAKEVNRRAEPLCGNGYDVEIKERFFVPFEIYNYIKKAGVALSNLSSKIDKQVVPVCEIDIIIGPNDAEATLDTFVSCFVKMFEDKIAATGRTIINFEKDAKNSFTIEVEDYYRNVFLCQIITREDYDKKRRGIWMEHAVDNLKEETRETINVFKRNGEMLSLPKGSTVIDFAFAIHEELGYALKSATINKHKAAIYSILQDQDRVIVEADTCRVNGITEKFVRHVRISWLKWVVTKKAKMKIIEFLSDRYEGDDPKYESEAQTEVVDSVADKILQDLPFGKETD